jgi:hypothetical protein
MALSAEQQAQVDIQNAIETHRSEQSGIIENKRAKLEAVRLAKDVLIENARSKPVSEREISASDISTFANTLITYINS